MKRSVLFIVLAFSVFVAGAQVFGTGSTLKKGTLCLGVEPSAFITSGENEYALFLHAGYGLTKGVDFGAKIGFVDGENYIGADLEFALGNRISLSGGFHDFHQLGLDGTLLFTFPLSKSARLTSGLDLDIIFPENEGDILLPLWVPISLEVDIRKNTVFILETAIDTKLIDKSYHFVGGGLQFYF